MQREELRTLNMALDASMQEALMSFNDRYYGAIEARLQELVAAGVPLSELAVEHHPFEVKPAEQDGHLNLTGKFRIRLRSDIEES